MLSGNDEYYCSQMSALQELLYNVSDSGIVPHVLFIIQCPSFNVSFAIATPWCINCITCVCGLDYLCILYRDNVLTFITDNRLRCFSLYYPSPEITLSSCYCCFVINTTHFCRLDLTQDWSSYYYYIHWIFDNQHKWALNLGLKLCPSPSRLWWVCDMF